MITIIIDNTILHIEDGPLSSMYKYRQQKIFQKEAGGILLGKKNKYQDEYFITDITVPGEFDKRSLNSFVRKKESAQLVIDKKWKLSDGIVNYLGEWHTHNEKRPMPSRTDKNLINKIVHDKSSMFSKVFLIIVGNTNLAFIEMRDSENKKLNNSKIEVIFNE